MLLDYIKSDLCRYIGKDKITWKKFFRAYFSYQGFRLCFWLRVGKFSRSKILRFIAKIQHRRTSRKYFLDIPIKTEIGYGFYLGHGSSIVVNGSTKIGNNVNLSQFTTIGANHGQAAIIGDNVYIGPNVCIVEHITIGDNVKIGAGAVVTKNIPNNSICAGVPARVLKTDETPNNYIARRW
ncbi:serine acetyltransferase [Vibrio kanaloae]|uniref:serine O-acetyltransferase n=1 Tax=Vibrio kanaloae TaxID=170673 RepID=UPI00148E3C2A|nr:DapH/DapD/GlmU-related protein [Vibrio kanaloae]NOI03217.1 serine acetyltransferase [Vibrio kanaloae]